MSRVVSLYTQLGKCSCIVKLLGASSDSVHCDKLSGDGRRRGGSLFEPVEARTPKGDDLTHVQDGCGGGPTTIVRRGGGRPPAVDAADVARSSRFGRDVHAPLIVAVGPHRPQVILVTLIVLELGRVDHRHHFFGLEQRQQHR